MTKGSQQEAGKHIGESQGRSGVSEELGKIEKLPVASFKAGRRLYFVPLIYPGQESPSDYLEKYQKYWSQVENQLSDLELKLGKVSRIYHELTVGGGEDGSKMIKELNEKSYEIVKGRLEKGAQLEAVEEGEILTEFLDWSRCLMIGLQNQTVWTKVYELYTTAGKKRNEHMAKCIDETLKAEETGILLMREGHQVQFPADIEVFYISPPALDEIKRWLRDQEQIKTEH